MGTLTRIPFGLKGEIYRSPMPFGDYDLTLSSYSEFTQKGISVVVMLVSKTEAYKKSGHELKELYTQDGLQVIHLPIEDYGVPERIDLIQAVDRTITLARQGKNVVIH